MSNSELEKLKDQHAKLHTAIEKMLDTPVKGKKVSKTHLEFLKKLLNYVVKYNEYNFNDNLINILPKKYRP